MIKAAQEELLLQEAIHAAAMCMSMFDEFVLHAPTVFRSQHLSEQAQAVSEQMYTFYNMLGGVEDEQN